jgi:hypothetical protein
VRVISGEDSLGEGIVETTSNRGETYVVAQAGADPAAIDSILIITGRTGIESGRRLSYRDQKHAVIILNNVPHLVPLPSGAAPDNLIFTMYSLSGRKVFEAEGVDAAIPLRMNADVKPGIYMAGFRTAKREATKGRMIVVR